MSSAAKAGFTAHILVTAPGGANLKRKIAEVRDLTLNINAGEINVSSHDSSEWEEFIAGLKRWTLTGGMLYVVDDSAGTGVEQKEVFDLLAGPSALNYVDIELCPAGATVPTTTTMVGSAVAGQSVYRGRGTIGTWSLAAPQNDALACNVEIRGKGALSRVPL